MSLLITIQDVSLILSQDVTPILSSVMTLWHQPVRQDKGNPWYVGNDHEANEKEKEKRHNGLRHIGEGFARYSHRDKEIEAKGKR